MNIRHTLTAILIVLMAACGKAPEPKEFTVKGSITNYPEHTLTIHELTPKGLIFLDSAAVNDDGSFELKGSVSEKTFAVIQLKAGSVVLVIDSLSDMVLSIDASKPEEFTVNGSPETGRLQELLRLNYGVMAGARELEKKYAMYNDENVPPLTVQERIRSEFDSIMMLRARVVSDFVLGTENSLVPYFVSNYYYFGMDRDYEFLKKVDDKFYPEQARSKYAQELHRKVEILGKTAIGSIAPDIVLPDPFGKTVSLSSLRGKTVLVDFWASWCKPCREENPNIVKAYNKYKLRGFDVFSVSLDENREAWQKAINDDRLLWTHVSDLQKWNSSVVSQYNFEGIPFSVLIDPEGKIIAKDLRGKALDEKLAEVLR